MANKLGVSKTAPVDYTINTGIRATPAAIIGNQQIDTRMPRTAPAAVQSPAAGGGGTEKIEVTANLILDGDKIASTVINAVPRNKKAVTDRSTSMIG